MAEQQFTQQVICFSCHALQRLDLQDRSMPSRLTCSNIQNSNSCILAKDFLKMRKDVASSTNKGHGS